MEATSVHQSAQDTLNVVFGDDMVGLWTTIFPKEDQTLSSIASLPSSGGEKRYHFSPLVDDKIKKHIQDNIQRSFESTAHGESFWENLLLQFRCSFASSLISYRLEPKEGDVINGLVLPMMRTLIPSISFLPNSKCQGFHAHLLTGDCIPKVVKGPGRNPEMDVVIQLVDLEA